MEQHIPKQYVLVKSDGKKLFTTTPITVSSLSRDKMSQVDPQALPVSSFVPLVSKAKEK